jgi:hypothetical protein
MSNKPRKNYHTGLFTPKAQRKMVAASLEALIVFFDGDADAMYEAIADYRAKHPDMLMEIPPTPGESA